MNSETFSRPLFGKEISITTYGAERSLVEPIIRDAYREALRLQKIFNFFDDKSELSLLNKKKKAIASSEMKEVLISALKLSKETNGKYDVSLGKTFLERKNNLDLKKSTASYRDILITRNKIEIKNPEVLIDLGSIAKGYITDKIGEFLKEKGIEDFIIDSRGDILISGKYNYILGVQHPRYKKEEICKIKLQNQGVATSGDYSQFDKTFERSHIINQGEIISVTVVASTLKEADLYATAIFVCPMEKIDLLMKKNKKIKALLIYKDLRRKLYNNFEELIQ